LVPIPDCYWVRDGLLLAGEYPGDWGADEARSRIASIVGAGIASFIDLTAELDGLVPYEALLRAQTSPSGAQVTYARRSIPDMGVPTPEVMRAILNEIDAHLTAGRPTYVHCWGGIGRTGTVVGCYLVRHGLSGEDALAQVARMFATMRKAVWNPDGSPQTDEQRLMVYEWAQHDSSPTAPSSDTT
jgi:protein-tyrosine phosphatase